MHAADAKMMETGDMSVNRKNRPDKMSPVFKIFSRVFPLFIKTGKFEVFIPDFTIDESFELSACGFDARIIHLPGHSKGSIGILTSESSLLCGDFLYNMLGFSYIDDLSDFRSSIEKLKKLNVNMVYPGHGRPFSMEGLLRKYN